MNPLVLGYRVRRDISEVREESIERDRRRIRYVEDQRGVRILRYVGDAKLGDLHENSREYIDGYPIQIVVRPQGMWQRTDVP